MKSICVFAFPGSVQLLLVYSSFSATTLCTARERKKSFASVSVFGLRIDSPFHSPRHKNGSWLSQCWRRVVPVLQRLVNLGGPHKNIQLLMGRCEMLFVVSLPLATEQ